MKLSEAFRLILSASFAGTDQGQSSDGLYVQTAKKGIIHVANREREVTNDDLEVFRTVMKGEGYREVKSWVCYAGQSWLSGGVSVGVSFEVAPDA